MSDFYYDDEGKRVYEGEIVGPGYDDGLGEISSRSHFKGLTSYRAMKEHIMEQSRTQLTLTTLDDMSLVAEKEGRFIQKFPHAAARFKAAADVHALLTIKQMRRW